MSKQYTPQTPFNVPFKILSLTKELINGVQAQSYVEGEEVYFCSAKSYGGTEKIINDVYVIEDTLEIDTWFISTLKSKDRIKLLDDDSIYEVLNTPENINRRNQYMKFKVVRIHG
jgi:hypothetical protein